MNTLAFGLGSLSGMDLLIILGVGLLIFGGRLPQVGRNLGKGIVEFKKGLKSVQDDIESDLDEEPAARRRESLPERERAYRQPLSESGEERRVPRSEPVTDPRPADSGN